MGRKARADIRVGSRRRRAPDDDAGFTLVEIIMAIVIMTIIAVPTMNAVITSIRADTENGNLADVQTVLQNAVDQINRAPKGCDYTQYAQAAAVTQGWKASQVTVSQQHYVAGVTPDLNGTWTANACDGTSPTALLVQMVTITVASPDAKIQKTLQVVKSDV
ncbi:MAG: hypothetical protein JWM34_5233 [Ilumatobacteraceae bacterium]|nr:hypothetical protein [Ilumatobacteraceae bacterium]